MVVGLYYYQKFMIYISYAFSLSDDISKDGCTYYGIALLSVKHTNTIARATSRRLFKHTI